MRTEAPAEAASAAFAGASASVASAATPAVRPPFDVRTAIPASCTGAHRLAGERVAELGTRVPSEVRAEAERFAASPAEGATPAKAASAAAGTPPAKAWSDFAAGASLSGHAEIAAWAGLQAAELDWSGTDVRNAGIYLLQLDRCSDSLALLQCAESMGDRSPYLFEAIANASRCNGDGAAARAAIARAAAGGATAGGDGEGGPEGGGSAIGDPFIDYEQSEITNGKPPAPPPPPPSPTADPITLALRVLERRADELTRAMRAGAEQGDRIRRTEGDEGASAAQYVEAAVEQVRGNLDSVRMLASQARAGGASSALPPTAAKALAHAQRNAFFELAARTYDAFTTQLLSVRVAAADEQDQVFTAELLLMDADELAREVHETREAKHTSVTGRDIADAAVAYYEDEADEAEHKKLDGELACDRRFLSQDAASQAAVKACKLAINGAWCRSLRSVADAANEQARFRFELAAHNFDRTAFELLDWSSGQLYRARRFNQWALARLDLAAGNAEDRAVEERLTDEYRRLVRFALSEEEQGPAAFIRKQASKLALDRQNEALRQDAVAATIERQCSAIERRELEALSEDQSKAYREYLLERFLSDFDVEWNDTLSCEGKLGPFSFSIDDSGKVEGSAKLPGVDVGFSRDAQGAWSRSAKWEWSEERPYAKIETTRRNGQVVAVSVGTGGEPSYGDFGGKFEGTLSSEWNESKGEWENSAQLTASLGPKLEGDVGGLSVGVGCFPGSASVKFEPRAVMDDAVAWYEQGAGGASPPQ